MATCRGQKALCPRFLRFNPDISYSSTAETGKLGWMLRSSSKSSSGGMYTYSPASQSFARLVLTSFAQRLITIQYEISGLMTMRIAYDEKSMRLLTSYFLHHATSSGHCSIARGERVVPLPSLCCVAPYARQARTEHIDAVSWILAFTRRNRLHSISKHP